MQTIYHSIQYKDILENLLFFFIRRVWPPVLMKTLSITVADWVVILHNPIISYCFIITLSCRVGRCRNAPEQTVPMLQTATWMKSDITRVNSSYSSVTFIISYTSYVTLEAFDQNSWRQTITGPARSCVQFRIAFVMSGQKCVWKCCLCTCGKKPQKTKGYKQSVQKYLNVYGWGLKPALHRLIDKVAIDILQTVNCRVR